MVFLLVFTGVEIAATSGWLTTLDYFYSDLWHRLSGKRREPQQTVIVSIDDQTLLDFKDEPLVFWGPHFARVIDVLHRVGAKAIGVDVIFLTSAESWLKKFKIGGNEQSRTFDLELRRQLAAGQVVLAGQSIPGQEGKREFLLPLDDYVFVLPGGLADVGLANFSYDADGVTRHFLPSLFEDENLPRLSLATLLAVQAAGLPPEAGGWSWGHGEVLNAPKDCTIGFVGPPQTIPRISFRQLLQPDAQKELDILSLKDKVIIISAEYSGNQDVHLTPYARGFLWGGASLMTGAEVHANIVETLLSGQFPRVIPSWLRLLYLAGLLALATGIFSFFSPWKALGVGVALAVVTMVFSFLLFRHDWILPVINVQLALSLSYLGILGFRLTGEERQRTYLQKLFGRYVSEEVVEKLLSTGRIPDLGGEELPVAVLFSDIRNFTTISEQLRPAEVVEMLNVYLSRACEPILEQGGTIDKFIGDAIMAVFGSPVPYPDHARRACRAALALTKIAADFRAWMETRFPDRHLPEFKIGVGIHSGAAVIGNIGSPRRTEFTAIGDTVNAASRLEGQSKTLGWTIVVSADTVRAAGSEVVTGRQAEVQVKGRTEPLEVFELVDFN